MFVIQFEGELAFFDDGVHGVGRLEFVASEQLGKDNFHGNHGILEA